MKKILLKYLKLEHFLCLMLFGALVFAVFNVYFGEIEAEGRRVKMATVVSLNGTTVKLAPDGPDEDRFAASQERSFDAPLKDVKGQKKPKANTPYFVILSPAGWMKICAFMPNSSSKDCYNVDVEKAPELVAWAKTSRSRAEINAAFEEAESRRPVFQ